MSLGRLDPVFVLTWLAVTALALPGATWCLRWRAASGGRRALQAVAVGAPLLAAVTSVAVLGSGVHPLAQYNDPAHLGGHRLWVALWFVLAVGTLAGAVVALRSVPRGTGRERVGSTLLLGLNALAFQAVVSNFPSA